MKLEPQERIVGELDGFTYIYEPSPTGSRRTLLLLHGTGGDENVLLPLGRELDADAALVSVRGHVLDNGRLRFFRSQADSVFDMQDVAQQSKVLGDFIASACRAHNRDAKQLIAVGHSNGANITASMLLRGNVTLGGALLLRARVPFELDQPADARGTPVLLLGGTKDRVMPREQVETLAAKLEQTGATFEIKWLEAGHEVSKEDVRIAREWLHALKAD